MDATPATHLPPTCAAEIEPQTSESKEEYYRRIMPPPPAVTGKELARRLSLRAASRSIIRVEACSGLRIRISISPANPTK